MEFNLSQLGIIALVPWRQQKLEAKDFEFTITNFMFTPPRFFPAILNFLWPPPRRQQIDGNIANCSED
jgi:hypothetical protein